MKPLLLIDIDGVLAPFNPHGMTSTNWARKQANVEPVMVDSGWVILLKPENKQRLQTLAQHFELIWATMWQDKANEFIGPWHGLPELPHVSFVQARWEGGANNEVAAFVTSGLADGASYKLKAIAEFVGDRPFAWIDDHIYDDALSWANERWEGLGIPTLMVPCQPESGLGESEFEDLILFAEDVALSYGEAYEEGEDVQLSPEEEAAHLEVVRKVMADSGTPLPDWKPTIEPETPAPAPEA